MSEYKRTVLRSIDEEILASDDKGNWVCIDLIDDLRMVSIENRRFIYYTNDGHKYYDFLRLGEFESHSLGLISFDSTNVVNITKIKHFDETWNNLYFVQTPTNDSLRASITKIMASLFGTMIKEIIMRNRAREDSEHIDPSIVQDVFLSQIKKKMQKFRNKLKDRSKKIGVDYN
ncbi:hypothetical protein SD70_29735 [Gordoniibacillus kamchatkensis]|uniref:YokE-like PH domain-containing protein n=1 Tax=Gordoniibacillus kamchatkensis TaxID=1590651 RepID=A0ABR5AAG1_9BACL|nr:hypothetical protein [Paenibacillus sp. VKM B-2647]KIL37967.1 hypothetical protein SD70_29735 [Paenibacillus sp. VKM B-2647]